MSIPTAPKLEFIGASETIITVAFTPNNKISSYNLCWKEYGQDWEEHGKSMIVTCDQSGQEIRVNTQDLNPGTTYALRMIGLDSDGKKGKPSPELVIDTESVGCGPRSNKCNIM